MKVLVTLFVAEFLASVAYAQSVYTSDSCRQAWVMDEAVPTDDLPCMEVCQKKVTKDTSRILKWQITYKDYSESATGQKTQLTDSEKSAHFQCLWDELQLLGCTNMARAGYSEQDIVCHASLDQIESAVQTSAISGVEVECTPDECAECVNHPDEAACLADGFCTGVFGYRWNSEDSCAETQVYAGCGHFDVCIASLTVAVGPSQTCWLFNDGCFPDDFTSVGANSQCLATILDGEGGIPDLQNIICGSDSQQNLQQTSSATRVVPLFGFF